MLDNMFTIPKKKGVIHIVLLYRYISLVLTSSIYVITNPTRVSSINLFIIICLIMASLIFTYLYLENRTCQWYIVLLLLVEFFGNCTIIAVSGGFKSPFIWYFTSTILIGMMEIKRRYIGIFAALYFVVAGITSLEEATRLNNETILLYINIGISYLLVVFSFSQMINYAANLQKNSENLTQMNYELEKTKEKVEKTLNSSIEIYEMVSILHLNNQKVIYQDLLRHFSNLAQVERCILVRLEPISVVGKYECWKINQEEANQIVKEVLNCNYLQWCELNDQDSVPLNEAYSVFPVRYATRVFGAFVYTESGKRIADESLVLYLKLAGIILRKLDFDEVGEQLIISEEQNRIANEVHDIVLQKLFAISCNLYLLGRKCDDEKGPIERSDLCKKLGQVKQSVDITMKELREAIYGMSWEKNGEDMFLSRINDYIKEIKILHQIEIKVDIDGDTQHINVNQKTVLFRIICEAVNNAIRHGKAKEVKLSIDIDEVRTKVSIIDNGTGFDWKSYRDKETKGLGMKNICRIVSLLHGLVDIESEKNEGVTVVVEIPNGKS